MSGIIADCLRAKGVRYFHGHHEQEYFFLLDFLGHGAGPARPGKLHIHLDRGGPTGDEVTVTVTPDRFYPAAAGVRLTELADRWSAGLPGAKVSVHPSSDPALVGVVAATTARPGRVADLTAQLDTTVAAALDLFARMGEIAGDADGTGLRDAG